MIAAMKRVLFAAALIWTVVIASFVAVKPALADASACINLVGDAITAPGAIAENIAALADHPECTAHAEDPLFLALTGMLAVLDAAGVFQDNYDSCNQAINGAITAALVQLLAAAINDSSSPLNFFLEEIQQASGLDLVGLLNDYANQIKNDPTVAQAVHDALAEIPGLDVFFGYLDCACRVATVGVITAAKEAITDGGNCLSFLGDCVSGKEDPLSCAGDLLASGLDAVENLVGDVAGDIADVAKDIYCLFGGCDSKPPDQWVDCTNVKSPLGGSSGGSFTQIDPNTWVVKGGGNSADVYCSCNASVQHMTQVTVTVSGSSGSYNVYNNGALIGTGTTNDKLPINISHPALQCVCNDPQKIAHGDGSCSCPLGTALMVDGTSVDFSNDDWLNLSCGVCPLSGTIFQLVGGNVCLQCPSNQVVGGTSNSDGGFASLFCRDCGARQVPTGDHRTCRYCNDGEIVSPDGLQCVDCLASIIGVLFGLGNAPMVLSDDGKQCISAICPNNQRLISVSHAGYTGFHCGCDGGSILDQNGMCVMSACCPDWAPLNTKTNMCENTVDCGPGQKPILLNKENHTWGCGNCDNANSCVVDQACIPCPNGTHVNQQNNCVPDNPDQNCVANSQPKLSISGTNSACNGGACLVFQKSCEPCVGDEQSKGGNDTCHLDCGSGETASDHTCKSVCDYGSVFVSVDATVPIGGHLVSEKITACVPCTGDTYADYGPDHRGGKCLPCWAGSGPNKDHTTCLTPQQPQINCGMLGADFVRNPNWKPGQPGQCILQCGTGRQPNADGTACVSSCLVTASLLDPRSGTTNQVCLTNTFNGVAGSNQTPCNGRLEKFRTADGIVTACLPSTFGAALPAGGGIRCSGEFYSLDRLGGQRIQLCLKAVTQPVGTAALVEPEDCSGGLESYSNASGFKLSFCHSIPRADRYKALGIQPANLILQTPPTTSKPKTAQECATLGAAFIRDPRDASRCTPCGRGLVPNAARTSCVAMSTPPPRRNATVQCPPRTRPNASGTGCVPELDLGDQINPGSSIRVPGGGLRPAPGPTITPSIRDGKP
ncbi:MAG TPA: hypothetical protein VLX09_12890 [Stellaceae bacterium]|nr:hypothetical protein [Xanthobacteraceae bacterium]HUK08761.1 hypothetical protein [Stellaceae bacterium]